MKNIIRNVRKWGNSSGVLLPREWEGKEVKVTLIDRTLQIKKEVLDILGGFLGDVQGIYLAGSCSRGEEEEESDIDIIAVSGKTRKEIVSGRYHVSIYPLETIRAALHENPIMIYPRILEAKPILNSALLEELKNAKIVKNLFRPLIEETKRIIRINSGLLRLENKGEGFVPPEIIYSLVLRLRGVFIMESILRDRKYSGELFRKWLGREIGPDAERVYGVYKAVKDGTKPKAEIKNSTAEKILNLLETEVKKHDRQKEAA